MRVTEMPDAKVNKAVILAAGRGKRMGSFTEQTPKPMLLVDGKPMLEHILGRLSAAGVAEFCIVVGYQHEQIEAHFRQSSFQVEFHVQDPVDGTGSAALLARAFTGDEPFFLTYGDILCDPAEYTRCQTILQQQPATSAIVAVKDVDDPWQGAAVYEVGGRISKIVEKPPQGTSLTRWNSAGFYVFQPVVYDYLDRIQPTSRNEYELTSALELMLEDRLELRISALQGDWRDVGRPEDLAAVNLKSS